MNKPFHETEYVSLTSENNILSLLFKKGPITLEIAQEIVEKRLEFSENKKFPVLVTDTGKGISSLDRGAREFMGKGRALEGISASAFYTSSPLNKYIINFFLRISAKQTNFPIKIFSDKNEAIKWLETFVEEK